MNKRYLFAGLATLPFMSAARAANKSGTYTVPKGVNLIRVRSTIDDKEVLDTHFKVVPGQVFVITAAE